MKDAAIIQAEISLNRENGYEGGEERAAGPEKARVSDGGRRECGRQKEHNL